MRNVRWLRIGVALAVGALVGLAYGEDAAASKSQAAKAMKVDPQGVTALMGGEAALTGGLKEEPSGSTYKRFWVKNWKSTNDCFQWMLDVPKEGDYSIAMLIRDETRAGDLCELEFSVGDKKLTHTLKRLGCWDRPGVEGTVHLPVGKSVLALRATRLPAKPKLSLFSIELVCTDAKKALDEKVRSLRASTDWLVQAKYGVMFHWNARSKPRQGPAKPFADACRDFDVEAFASAIQQTGAGFAVITTSWADYYFPAPVKAIDEVLPGRTSQRDMVGDLADALNKRGLKLILYYHPGHDDTPWWSKTGYDKEGSVEFFDLWCKVVSEVGERYGTKLAGWWFDDGIACYYPKHPSWEKMTKAAKAGNPARVIGYNAWILPRATDFQDFSCGEGDFCDFIGRDFVPKGGSGKFIGGPQEGLQAVITWMLEPGNWCHLDLDKEIAPPAYSKERLTDIMRVCVARRVVPMINMEAYQDGTLSPASVAVLHAVGEAIKGMKEKPEDVQGDIGPKELLKGDIALESVDGKREGSYLTYVENVDCITCWRNTKSQVKWSLVAPESGKYSVIVTLVYGNGPSEYEVKVGEQKLTGKIAGIGAEPGWSDYQDDVVGTVDLVKGQTYEVAIHVSVMPKGSPMNLRRIVLRPVK